MGGGLSWNSRVVRYCTVCSAPVLPRAWLPKPMDLGEKPRAAKPVPSNATVCVPAPSFNVTEAVRGPAADGVKITLIVQPAPTAMLVPHPFVWLKLGRFVPVIVVLVMDNTTLPEF